METPAPKYLAILLTVASLASATPLPRSTPEAQGISSRAMLEFIEAADQEIDTFNSVMVVRHGQVVAEGWWAPYGAEIPHQLYSLSKSFTSTAIGMLVTEGKLKLTDPVLSFFPEYAPDEPSDNLKAMRIHDLLIMSTGHDKEPKIWDTKESWAKVFLNQPVPHKPGAHFLYNTPASYMLSAIAQKVTGQTLLAYLQPRLFEPLDIEHPTWDQNDEGINTGGWGLSVRTEDIAKFGQLYLQKGRWGDRQLLPTAWVEEATSLRTSNGSAPDSDWDQGYGYQFWLCRPLHAYRGDGAYGQYCIVLPDQDAVVAITSGVGNMQAVMNLVWTRLLPAMQPDALPADPDAQAQLTAKLASLAIAPQAGAPTSPRANAVAGQIYTFPENEQKLEALTLIPRDDGTTLVGLTYNGQSRTAICQPDKWEQTRMAFGRGREQPVTASGAWISADTYSLRFCAYETPFTFTLQLKFDGDEVRYQFNLNVRSDKDQQPSLIGKVSPTTTE